MFFQSHPRKKTDPSPQKDSHHSNKQTFFVDEACIPSSTVFVLTRFDLSQEEHNINPNILKLVPSTTSTDNMTLLPIGALCFSKSTVK
mmetsp:Transcript_6491/g.14751  ORF Transcript_6491/g.14751 Transcript_6491/m.14751 type:complete len:88 (+) Transcript_6491:69-332(+)